jgi:hypothetical protein
MMIVGKIVIPAEAGIQTNQGHGSPPSRGRQTKPIKIDTLLMEMVGVRYGWPTFALDRE